MPDNRDSCVGSGDMSTHEDKEEEDSDDFFDRDEGAIGDRLSLSTASERSQSGGGTSCRAHYTQRRTDNGQRHNVTQSDHSQLFTHDLIGLSGPQRRRVGRPNADTHNTLKTVLPVLPRPITKTKLSSSAKSQKRKELVVEREDGFIREEVVPCRCTQATRITSALHPLTIFIL